jgi:hypothetical protein
MDTATPPPVVQPPPPLERQVRVALILRDIVIIVALTFIGGFVIGLAADPTSTRGMLAIAASNLLLGTVGFVISGCLAVGSRRRHLAFVGLGVWIAGLMNVLLFGFGFIQWFLGFFAVALMMGVGGAISYLFKSVRRDATR